MHPKEVMEQENRSLPFLYEIHLNTHSKIGGKR